MREHAAHIDMETKSDVDLKKSGIYVYVESPYTWLYGFSYRLPGEHFMRRWRPGAPDPVELLEHIRLGRVVTGHNAPFERNMWNCVLRRYLPHWPMLFAAQQSCTLARAANMNLPLGLDNLAKVLQLRVQKDMEGHALMLRMCKPKTRINGVPVFEDDPAKLARLEQYQDNDVWTEDAADRMLPELTAEEHENWLLDNEINDRGFHIDRRMVEAASRVVEIAKAKANARAKEICGLKLTQTKALVEWINAQGIPCESVGKGHHDEILCFAEVFDRADVAEIVALRKASAKTSTAKYDATLMCVCADNRVRGTLQYYGATQTGRQAGRLVQPQNYPRVDHEKEGDKVNLVIDLLTSSYDPELTYELIKFFVGEPLIWLAKALRATICAEYGNKLIGGDFSNIEGRVNAWLAGEQWKLDAFRDYDNGTGDDLYKLAYARAFNIIVAAVTKDQRQIGKVMELALGYQGSVQAFISMGAGYGVKVSELADAVREVVDDATWSAVLADYNSARDKCGLTPHQWTGVTIVVRGWRRAHPKIVGSWWELQDAAIEAVETPGIPVPVYGGKCAYLSDGHNLYCRLPSGRVIVYPECELQAELDVYIDKRTGEERQRIKKVVYYKCEYQKKWLRYALYGGIQCENIVQAVARDMMYFAAKNIKRAGYPLILMVHDELLAELPSGLGSAEHFAEVMRIQPGWSGGLPVAVAAWEDQRYVK